MLQHAPAPSLTIILFGPRFLPPFAAEKSSGALAHEICQLPREAGSNDLTWTAQSIPDSSTVTSIRRRFHTALDFSPPFSSPIPHPLQLCAAPFVLGQSRSAIYHGGQSQSHITRVPYPPIRLYPQRAGCSPESGLSPGVVANKLKIDCQ